MTLKEAVLQNHLSARAQTNFQFKGSSVKYQYINMVVDPNPGGLSENFLAVVYKPSSIKYEVIVLGSEKSLREIIIL